MSFFLCARGNHLTISIIFNRDTNVVWSYRLAVRTLASHAGNAGSIPAGTTTNDNKGLR
jgi:hypothetical protein